MRFDFGYLIASDDLQEQEFPSLSCDLVPDPVQLTITAFLKAYGEAGTLNQKDYQRCFGFVRKTRAACIEYCASRDNYREFWSDKGSDRDLIDALSHLENLVRFIVEAHELLFGLRGNRWRDDSQPGRMHLNERVKKIHNSAKHMHGTLNRHAPKTGSLRLPFIAEYGLSN